MAYIDLGVDETQFPGITGPMQVKTRALLRIAAAVREDGRYVDGLGTLAIDSAEGYAESARRIVEHGYLAAK